jgi:hypothetical protein
MTLNAMGSRTEDCLACDSLYVIHLYTRIARRRAETTDGLIVRRPAQNEESPNLEGKE